jgi:hypothetical protein
MEPSTKRSLKVLTIAVVIATALYFIAWPALVQFMSSSPQ